jgi:hypothetical protein
MFITSGLYTFSAGKTSGGTGFSPLYRFIQRITINVYAGS